jgi:rRNA-processing protein FCF1
LDSEEVVIKDKALREEIEQILKYFYLNSADLAGTTYEAVKDETRADIEALITSKVIEELESLNKKREYQVRNHGLTRDTQGKEYNLVQTASDTWENTIKLRIKELNNTLKKQGG